MRHKDGTVEAVIAELARVRHGVVTRRHLLAAGVTLAEVWSRLRSGSLLLEYPGVYRVGHRAPSREAAYLAAVEACGDRTLLRGLAAAHLHRVIRGPAPPPEVVAPTERRIEGIITCRSRRFDPREATVVLDIPVTTVARTLVDLAGVLSAPALARACHEADVLHRTTPGEVEAVLAWRPRSPGAGRLRAVLRGDMKVTLSTLERRFLRLLRAEGLPLPVTNRPAGGRRVDCRWPELRLTVELDSYQFHRSRHAWEQDRRREREAHARGDAFRRYTYGDVCEEPRLMLAELQNLLHHPILVSPHDTRAGR
jgi:very-short-patch-repair endonuclease